MKLDKLLETGRTCAPSVKLQREEKFASEIFGETPQPFRPYCNAMNGLPKAGISAQTRSDQKRIMEFTIDSLDEKRRFSLHRYAGNDNWECNKELVTTIRLPIPGGRPTETNMPRYFFNTRIGDELVVDPDGEVLRDPDRAWEVARAMILEILKAEGPHAGLVRAVVEVTDEGGEIVLEFPFTEALLDMPDESMTRH